MQKVEVEIYNNGLDSSMFQRLFPLDLQNLHGLLRESRCYIPLVEIKCMWPWKNLLKESMQETWCDHVSPQFPKLDPWSSNKTKVVSIRLMITSAAQFLTSSNGASGSSEKSAIMKKYWDLLLTLGSLSSLLSHTCCELFNIN